MRKFQKYSLDFMSMLVAFYKKYVTLYQDEGKHKIEMLEMQIEGKNNKIRTLKYSFKLLS